MHLKRNSVPHKILKCALLAGGVLLVASSGAGGAGVVTSFIKDYIRKEKFKRERFLQDLKRLQTRKLAEYKELEDGRIRIVLTKLGRKKVLFYDLDEMKLNAQKKWDGFWRIVLFDIPHEKRQARDVFRGKLKSLDFYPLQKSVFITPYECENEIDFICAMFDIRDHIVIFNTKNFEGEEKMKHHFRVEI